MRVDTDLASWITLTQISGLGNERLLKLLAVFGSPESILSAPAHVLSEIVKPSVVNAIRSGLNNEATSIVEEWLVDESNSVVSIADVDYPSLLLNIPDPPPILYTKGNRALLSKAALAVVGSRNATLQGKRNASAFAESASISGLCIASGLAHGIDAAAHAGGLKGRGSSIAVVGTGLDRVYPAANRELAHQLATNGVILSEFPLGTPPLAANFPRRNRIISGLSLGCLVVEASLRSGSLITARLAAEQGREVFAIPGSIHSPQSKGCHLLIKQGAKLVEDVSDILEELHFASAVSTCSQSASENHSCDPLLSYMGHDAIDLDSLAIRSGLTIEQLSAILLQLELDGKVVQLPGGLYQHIC